jgi:O-antigen/teichoic acid export membrane protein
MSAVVATLAGGVILLLVPFATTVLRIPPEYTEISRFALYCEAAIAWSVFFFSPWLNMFVASQRVLSENISKTIERMLDLAAAALAFWVMPRFEIFEAAHLFVLYAGARALLRVSQQMFRAGLIMVLIPALRFRRSLISASKMRELGKESAWAISNTASNIGFYAVDQPFANVFFGLAYNTVYAIVARLQSMGQLLGNNVAFGLEAMVADHHELGRHELNKRIMLAGMRVTSSVTGFCIALVVVLTPQLIDVWIGKQLRQDATLLEHMSYQDTVRQIWILAAILLPSVWFSQSMLVSTRVMYATGHNRVFTPTLMAGAGLKIFIAWVGLKFFEAGITWIVWSTVIAQVWCCGIAIPRIIKRLYDVPIRSLFVEALLLPVLSIVPSTALLIVASQLVDRWGLIELMLASVAAGLVYAPSLFLFAMRRDERSRLVGLVRVGPKIVSRMKEARRRGGDQSPGSDPA